MSLKLWFEESEPIYYDSSTGYGGVLKSIVAFLVNTDPNLAIYQVESDTTSTYKVYLSVGGTEWGWCFYNSGVQVYYQYGKWVDGTWKSSGSYASNVLHSGGIQHYVFSYGIGDCIAGFHFGPNSYSSSSYRYYIYGAYRIFTSSTTDGLQCCFTCAGQTTGSTYSCKGIDITYGMTWYNPNNATFETLTHVYPNNLGTALSRCGNSYNYSIYTIHMYTSTFGLLDVKWGTNGYDVLALYNGSSMVSAAMGTMATIDGQSNMAIPCYYTVK